MQQEVNSSMSGSTPNVMSINKPGVQNVVVTTQNIVAAQPPVMSNLQILNVRQGAPQVAAQKSVETVSPRVVIGAPQMVGGRPNAPSLTLQTIQSLQQGQQGHLLLKTENGQYQLLRVGPAPTVSNITAPQGQTIRLSTVPALPGLTTVSTSVMNPGAMGQIATGSVSSPLVASSVASSSTTQPPSQTQLPHSQTSLPVGISPQVISQTQTQLPQSQATVTTQKPIDNTKEKCRNFLANLLDLSSKEPMSVEASVRNLIQELIDAQVEPETFCERLERLLNASPQPCLIGFLKKSLPLLRQSLVTKELVIEGINPPSPQIAFSTIPTAAPPVLAATNITLPKPASKPAGGGAIAILQNIPVHQAKLSVSKMDKSLTGDTKAGPSRPVINSAALSTVLTPGKSLLKDKEKKTATAAVSVDDKMAGDDDINDVAAMGGVNLAEESQRILGSTDMIGTQIRSVKDEFLTPVPMMQARLKVNTEKHGLEDPSPDVAAIVTHAVHERLKDLIEKLATIAQHRTDHIIKTDSRYEPTQDVKGQLKFLEELERIEEKKREDSEREVLLRAAKSRSKNEDPEQAKLKAKAKEMQRAEMEEARQREANLTALQAIGPRKKPRTDVSGGPSDAPSTSGTQSNSMAGRSQLSLRTRITARDMLFLMEQDKQTARSVLLYRSYLR